MDYHYEVYDFELLQKISDTVNALDEHEYFMSINVTNENCFIIALIIFPFHYSIFKLVNRKDSYIFNNKQSQSVNVN